jgi:hypothetical protein
VSNHAATNKKGSLIDRGANGGILGNDARVTIKHQRHVDVTGIDNHELNSLRMVDAAARVTTQKGDVILILRQYAYHARGRTIHSAVQIEHNRNLVDDRSIIAGGTQCIRTLDGYIIPLDIIHGLPYMKMVPPTDDEYKTLPHVALTASVEWDPRWLDSIITDRADWYNLVKLKDEGAYISQFDNLGDYKLRTPNGPNGSTKFPKIRPRPIKNPASFQASFHTLLSVNERYISNDHHTEETDPDDGKIMAIPEVEVKKKRPNFKQYRPYFLFIPVEKIAKTFENTTQYASDVAQGLYTRFTHKTPYPMYNVRRHNEPVTTDTIFASVPSVVHGYTMAQLFIGRKSLYADAIGMKNADQFVNTLEDVIRKRGAMDKLISDSSSVETSKRVLDILRVLAIEDWQSEPGMQHQNFCEHRWKHIKRNVHFVMDLFDVPPDCWYLCLCWVCYIMNKTSERSLNWRTPEQVLTGVTPDISVILQYTFWERVYIRRYKDSSYNAQIGNEKASEISGRIVGISEHVGHEFCYKILTDDTRTIIDRSIIWRADGDDALRNKRLDDAINAVKKPKTYFYS